MAARTWWAGDGETMVKGTNSQLQEGQALRTIDVQLRGYSHQHCIVYLKSAARANPQSPHQDNHHSKRELRELTDVSASRVSVNTVQRVHSSAPHCALNSHGATCRSHLGNAGGRRSPEWAVRRLVVKRGLC